MREKELKIYQFVLDYNLNNNGQSPTLSQVGSALGYKSTSGIYTRLVKIMKKGFLERYRGRGWRALKEDGSLLIKPDVSQDYKKIELTQGKVTLVDNEDYDRISSYMWHASRIRRKNKNNIWYATRRIRKDGKQVTEMLHRFILNPPDELVVDHINRNGLDNRRANLRVCTHAQNMCNSYISGGTSVYKGVSLCESGKWRAGITTNKRRMIIGIYENELDAARAYNEAAKKYHGEFAYLNEIGE